ncbi:hypothetical protein MHU86_25322 [Fragilaria crotonensis]|nr:hypothetical protein MHU86_25322 [Fragilaria crotonensis]
MSRRKEVGGMAKRQRCTKDPSVGPEASYDPWRNEGNMDEPRIRVCLEPMDDAATTTLLPPPFPPNVMDAVSDNVADTSNSSIECDAVICLRKMWKIIESRKGSPWKPSSVQLQTWPILLQKSSPSLNLIAIAPTGSGKTLAFGLPILCNAVVASKKGVRAVCLLPTRELALQVANELKGPSSISSVKITCLIGGKGVDRDDQIQALHRAKRSSMIVVATPGRLLDLMEERSDVRNLFAGIEYMVLDEADRLAGDSDMCVQIHKIRAIFQNCGGGGKNVQMRTCLFSATKKRSVSEQWNAWAGKPRVVIQVDTRTFSQQHVTPLLASDNASIVGTSTTTSQSLPGDGHDSKKRKSSGGVFKLLVKEKGIGGECCCAEYHSKLSQVQRERTLTDFRSGKRTLLLATEIAARGIHVPNLEYVINYDFPDSLEQYVHRCGRAGRRQKNGKQMNGSVYIFFTKADTAAMASDVVEMLRATNSWLDPNLIALAEGK